MSSLLSRAEKEDKEPEITLSTTSLLGLFLGLVLICGVFFGFGYSVGRRSAASAPISPVNSTEEPDASERQAATPPAAQPPAVAEDAPVESSSTPAQAAPAPVTLPFVQTSPQTQPAPLPKAETAPPAIAKQAQKVSEVPPRPEQVQAVHAMVQVAAVVREEDADVLVAALRRKGFNAVVRNEPQDKLLHVQVGPFSSRADANATRQKLLSVGYNAIIKQ